MYRDSYYDIWSFSLENLSSPDTTDFLTVTPQYCVCFKWWHSPLSSNSWICPNRKELLVLSHLYSSLPAENELLTILIIHLLSNSFINQNIYKFPGLAAFHTLNSLSLGVLTVGLTKQDICHLVIWENVMDVCSGRSIQILYWSKITNTTLVNV